MGQIHQVIVRSIAGAAIGSVLVGFVTAVRVLGLAALHGAAMETGRYWTVSPLILVGAIASGAIGGVLYPWASTATKAILVGLVAGQPIVITILSQRLHGFESEFADLTTAWLAMTIVLAPSIGIGFIRNVGSALRYFSRLRSF